MANTTQAGSPGLTTTQAPFVEQARSRGQLFLEQPYELYSRDNHDTWRRLYSRIHPRWQRYANEHFLKGLDRLGLPPDRIPKLAEINALPVTAHRLSGPRRQRLCAGVCVFRQPEKPRLPHHDHHPPPQKLDYLPEPDIFHDLAGHVPMHTDARVRPDPGALRRVRPHCAGSGRGRAPRRAYASAAHQHRAGHGAVFLVHGRVRADALDHLRQARHLRLRQRPVEFLRRTVPRGRIAASRAKAAAPRRRRASDRSGSTAISLCCTSSSRLSSFTRWSESWNSGCEPVSSTKSPAASPA